MSERTFWQPRPKISKKRTPAGDIITITGPAGCGKTFEGDRIAQELTAEGHLVLRDYENDSADQLQLQMRHFRERHNGPVTLIREIAAGETPAQI